MHKYLSMDFNKKLCTTMREWLSLPPELLQDISQRIDTIYDYVRFRAVCGNWRSALPKSPQHLPCQIPWLMLQYNNVNNTHRDFYCFSEVCFHRLELPNVHGKYCCGSSQGWLIFIDNTAAISPMNKEFLPLYFNENNIVDLDIKKVVLSEKPTADNYAAMAICDEIKRLVFCRSGEHKWTSIGYNVDRYVVGFIDIIYHKGKFYCLNHHHVTVCDIIDTNPKVTIIRTSGLSWFFYQQKYLVELGGEITIVIRHTYWYSGNPKKAYKKTQGFSVWRLDLECEKWDRLKNLGHLTLFIGRNNSFSLQMKDVFGRTTTNCIYYTDWSKTEEVPTVHYLGIYNLEAEKLTSVPYFGKKALLTRNLPPSIWITPSLC